ncbi:MAG: alpha-L-fucosidase [Muribaculaceae bacterium]|nr:alpha-L-fucosidase [Muribaculaceae bacterium]
MAWDYTPTTENLEAREQFRDHGFGIFLHWGIYSMLGQGEWAMETLRLPYSEYKNLASGFCPSEFNADEWVKTFKDAGAGYITITTRHHDGFSMFDTKASDYNIMDATPFKRDIIKELAEACQRHGLKLHFYYSQVDWGRDDYTPLGGSGHKAGRKLDGKWEDYMNFMDAQLTELLTNYGPIGAIWYDGVWDKKGKDNDETAKIWNLQHQYELIHSLQPACLVGSNHHLTPYPGEDMQLFERDKPGENFAGYSGQEVSSLPLETCQTMNGTWGYSPTDRNWKSPETLIRLLVETAGKDANLLLNIGPRPNGTLPSESVETLKAIGDWMQTYGPTVKGVRSHAVGAHEWGVTTHRDKTMYVHVLNNIEGPVFIPYTGNKLKNAAMFVDGRKVPFTQNADGIILKPGDKPADTVDMVVELTFQNEI